MTETAHIFHPKDDSIEARIEAYRNVHQAWLNAEASLKFMESDEWSDTLGSREEIEKALNVSSYSLKMASNSFSKEEISEAKNAGLIDESEALDIIQNKLQDEMNSIRNSQSQSHSSSHSQKQ